jgi:hypothetical protein
MWDLMQTSFEIMNAWALYSLPSPAAEDESEKTIGQYHSLNNGLGIG